MTNNERVLVTGATGYIAKHCIVQLLEKGYRVRGTVRSLAREGELREIFAPYLENDEQIEFVEANLNNDAGWDAATEHCDYVLHTASPVPAEIPKDENEIIIPAVEGTRRVLKAALKAGVKRVVLTSSEAAIVYGHDKSKKSFDENDWSNTDGDILPYPKSKTLAERAAWDFVQENPALELATINPGMVIGPLLDKRVNSSVEPIYRIMKGMYPALPKLGWPFVDVRDIAAAHIAAMTIPEAVGQRFFCVTEWAWMIDIAKILEPHFSSKGYQIATRNMPDFVIRILGLFEKTIKMIVPNLGKYFEFSNQRSKQVLNWQPRSLEETVVDTAQSLIDFELV